MIAGCNDCGEDLRVLVQDGEVLLGCSCHTMSAQEFIDAHEDGEMNYTHVETDEEVSSPDSSEAEDRMFQ